MSKPSYFSYYEERGLLYLKMGDTTAAAADFQEAVRLYPGAVEAKENLRALGVPGY